MHVVVTEVEVQSIPFSAPGEDRHWDLFSWPDLYYEVYGPSADLLHTSEAVSDVRPADLPLALDAEISLTASGPHVLRLLDADLSESEVVGRVAFEPERLAEAGPGSEPPRCVAFEDGETMLQLTLTWKQRP